MLLELLVSRDRICGIHQRRPAAHKQRVAIDVQNVAVGLLDATFVSEVIGPQREVGQPLHQRALAVGPSLIDDSAGMSDIETAGCGQTKCRGQVDGLKPIGQAGDRVRRPGGLRRFCNTGCSNESGEQRSVPLEAATLAEALA